MPAHRRKQSNAMLYTLIIFVGLSIVATIVAVFYYVKAEEYRLTREDMQRDLDKYVSEEENSNIGSIVGQRLSTTSYIQTMVKYLDDTMSCVVGGVPESTSAEVKRNNAKSQTVDTLNKAAQYIDVDPNMTGLIQVVSTLTQKLQATMESKAKAQQDLEDKLKLFEQTEKANLESYQELLKEKEILRKDYNDVKRDYDDLSDLLKETTDERVQSLRDQLDRKDANLKKINDQLLETQAILSEYQTMLADAKEELVARFGAPREDSMAYIPDGQILSIDNKTKTVIINLGSNNHVFRGLTFSVYDKGAYIGQKGQDKAEIEIFDIGDSYSSARIVKSEINRPILKNDSIANLIWDSRKTNEFVIAGDFDLDKDGNMDADAVSKIKAIVEKWGGKVADNISIETDFLILGTMPNVPEKRPTIEDEIANPTAMQQYEKAVARLNRYNELQSRAKSLWVPIFTYDKFIHLIGYSGKIGQAGAF